MDGPSIKKMSYVGLLLPLKYRRKFHDYNLKGVKKMRMGFTLGE